MPLTDRELALSGRGSRLVFAGAVQGALILTATPTNLTLPSVTVEALPSGITINRAIAAIAWRKQVDSSGANNAIDGDQQIQVRSDAPGTFRDAVTISDNSLSTAGNGTEGGVMLLGDSDISIEVDGPDTYEFQWQNARVDGNNLTLQDVQTYLLLEYA